MSRLHRLRLLYGELRRRKVVRTAAAYVVAGAATIQLADVVFSALEVPGWALRALIVAGIVGLPIVIVLAWVYDIRREPEVAPDSEMPAQDASTDDAPPPPRPGRRYQVALPVTPLVGRKAELDTATRLLTQPHSRLLTLTGTGGIGKTRLAHEIAARASADYRHGACLVALASVDTVAPLPALIAEALELPLSGREPPARQLIEFLQEKSLLLFLDNFEQLVDGATLLTELLAHAPEVRVLTTSRRRLHVAGETVLPLEPLSLPTSGDTLHESDAAQLFLTIARRNDARFEPTAADADAIVRICRVVEGIPLAIELAAASVGVLSCVQIAREIEEHHELLLGARRDLPPRHQTLRAAFESSWRQLDEEGRRAFRRLSVFRSGFDRDDAQAVAGADLRLLARLVEFSFVRRPSGERFEMLEVMRQFGAEKLAEQPAEQADVQARHSAYFLERLEHLAAVETGAELAQALDRLSDAQADVHVVWERAVAAGAYDELGRGAAGLHRLMDARGRALEGADLLRRATAAVRPAAAGSADAGPNADPQAHAARTVLGRLLTRQAAFEVEVGRVSDGAALLDEGMALVRADGDRREIAFALSVRWGISRATADYNAPTYEESLRLYRELGDKRGIARALNSLGGARHALGAYDEAKQLYQESITLLRSIGLDAEAWPALNNLAGIAQVEGDYATARSILESELQASRNRQNPRALCFLLQNLSYVLYRAGDHDAARSIVTESIALAREMGYRNRLAYSLSTLASLEAESGSVARAEQTYREALHAAVAAEEAPLVTELLVGIARLDMKRGDTTRAATILTTVEQHPGCDEETRAAARTLQAQLDGQTPAVEMSLDDVLADVLAPHGATAIRN